MYSDIWLQYQIDTYLHSVIYDNYFIRFAKEGSKWVSERVREIRVREKGTNVECAECRPEYNAII